MNSENLVRFANDTAVIHNKRWEFVTSNHPEFLDTLEFTGNIRAAQPVKELIPNKKNPGLMDVAMITRYSGEFVSKYRKIGGKRIKTTKQWFYIGEEVEVIEVGSYYDKR